MGSKVRGGVKWELWWVTSEVGNEVKGGQSEWQVFRGGRG